MKMRFQTTIAVGVFALLALIIIVYGALALHGDPASYVSFVAPVMTTVLSLLFIAGKVDEVAHKTETIEKQTNGQMDAKFTDLKQHVTTQAQNAANVAIDATKEGDAG